MLYDTDDALLTLVTEATEVPVAEDMGAVAATATTVLAGGALVGLAAHTANKFMERFGAPKEGELVKHKDTGKEGVLMFQHHNGKLNVDWRDGSNSSHEKSEIVAL